MTALSRIMAAVGLTVAVAIPAGLTAIFVEGLSPPSQPEFVARPTFDEPIRGCISEREFNEASARKAEAINRSASRALSRDELLMVAGFQVMDEMIARAIRPCADLRDTYERYRAYTRHH